VAWEHGSVEDAQLGWGGSWLRLLSMWDRATWGHVGHGVRRMLGLVDLVDRWVQVMDLWSITLGDE
jgi:hypothetical protein